MFFTNTKHKRKKHGFFANAKYESKEYGITTIAICSDEQIVQEWKEKKTDDLVRVHYKGTIADEIMKAAAKDVLPISFSYRGINYRLLTYTCRPEERLYNKYRINHAVREEQLADGKKIFVYSERCRCTACYAQWRYDNIVNICGIIPTLDNPKRTVEIYLQYCTRCGNYFIDTNSLAIYERKYGLLKITKRHITGNEELPKIREPYTYKPDTILSRNGYSALKNTPERRKIITHLITSGKSSKAEIKDILTRFISQRGNRSPNGLAAWSSDLEFVNEFDIEAQDVVRFV